MKVSFTLPLDPRYCFTLQALEQLAEQIVDKPVRVGEDGPASERPAPGGYARGDLLGKVISAHVNGDRAECEVDMPDDQPLVRLLREEGTDPSDLYSLGVEATTASSRPRHDGTTDIETINRIIGVAAIPARLRPPGATPNIRRAGP